MKKAKKNFEWLNADFNDCRLHCSIGKLMKRNIQMLNCHRMKKRGEKAKHTIENITIIGSHLNFTSNNNNHRGKNSRKS